MNSSLNPEGGLEGILTYFIFVTLFYFIFIFDFLTFHYEILYFFDLFFVQNFDFCYFLGYDFGFRLFSDEILDLLASYTPSRPLGYVTGIYGTGIPDYT